MLSDAPSPPAKSEPTSWRYRLHEIIFEADTTLGKLFDIGLLVAIVLSVIAVMLETVPAVNDRYHAELVVAEWVFTILFTIEYLIRLLCVRKPMAYARSFFGVVDLVSILPTYLSLLFPGAQHLMVIRALRLLRLFRIFKLVRYLDEAETLWRSLRAAWQKITVFIFTVVVIVVIVGSLMNLIEGSGSFNLQPIVAADGSPVLEPDGRPAVQPTPTPGFESIPSSMYWAIVTMSTVGYGDITPATVPGKCLAALLIIVGYSLIIVPTGVLSAEMAHRASHAARQPVSTQHCPHCSKEGHDPGAVFCNFCGERL
ncbi:MAG: ion transporter [Planctomycetota bacterium]